MLFFLLWIVDRLQKNALNILLVKFIWKSHRLKIFEQWLAVFMWLLWDWFEVSLVIFYHWEIAKFGSYWVDKKIIAEGKTFLSILMVKIVSFQFRWTIRINIFKESKIKIVYNNHACFSITLIPSFICI